MPDAILIAGCNGAGKTTFARNFVPSAFPDAVFLNADEIQREKALSPLRAGRALIEMLDGVVSNGQGFVIETTLSSSHHARRFSEWRKAGYRIHLIFLEVPSAEFAVHRVAMRVRHGGHDIPDADIRRRYERGLREFYQTYRDRVDLWYHYKWNEDKYELFETNENI